MKRSTAAEWFEHRQRGSCTLCISAWLPQCTDMRRVRCAPLHCVHRLPMAAIAEGLPTLLDGAGLFLRLVARWNFCLTELHSRHGIA